MKKTFTLIVLLYSFFCYSQDDCMQVLRLSSRNYTNVEATSIMAYNIYQSHCGSSSTSSSFSLGLDSDQTAKLVSNIFGINANSKQSIMSTFCQNYESGYYGKDEYSKSTNLVVESAIRAWESCQKLKRDAVSFKINDGGNRITFDIKQKSGTPIKLTGVDYDDKCLSCYISKGRNTEKATKYSSEKIKNDKTLSITCKRLTNITDSIKFYPITDISINTNLGSLVAAIPEKQQPKYMWLKDVINEIDQIKKIVNNNHKEQHDKVDNLLKDLNTNFLNYSDIAFGGWIANEIGRYYGDNSTNIFRQGDGKNAVHWRGINGNDTNIFENGKRYRIHVFCNNRHVYVGDFEFGKTHHRINLSEITRGSRTSHFIAIKIKE